MRTARCLIACLVLAASAARAQPSAAPADARREARLSFERALALFDQHELQPALTEFLRAYELSPHFAVLYNIGRTYAALGRPVEAADALAGYLSEGGVQIDAARRTQVEALLAAQRARIGTLALDVAPAGASISVDERLLGTAPLSEPIRLAVGTHVVRVVQEGHLPFAQEVAVSAAEPSTLQVRLVPHVAAGAPVERGLLSLRCALPDVELRASGQSLGTTPLSEPVFLAPGQHTVELSREGYRSQQLSLTVQSAKLTQLACALAPSTPLRSAAELSVKPSEDGATVLIDGRGASPTSRLPSGRHRVEVMRPGFEPFARDVSLRSGERLAIEADLVPADAYRREYQAQAQGQRTWALVLGGSAIALAGVAVGVFVWNDGRHDDWSEEDRALTAALEAQDEGSGMLDAEALQRRQARNNDLLMSIHRVEVIDAATGVAALLLGTAGVVLWLTGDDPDRYPALEVKLGPGSVGLRATGHL